MSPSERANREQLDRFWDELSRGGAADTTAIDPTLAATVRQLRALHQPLAIEPTFQRRLKASLLGEPLPASVEPELVPVRSFDASAPVPPNGRLTRLPSRAVDTSARAPIFRRWTMAQLATAALILLTLVSSLVGLRYVTDRRLTAPNEAVGSAEVATLVDATVEGSVAGSMPLTVERWTFSPGNAALTVPPLDGPQWIVADDGPLTATVDGTQHHLAADSSIVIPAGQELVLGNPGQQEVSALRGFARSTYVLEDYDRSLISMQPALETEAHQALPAGSSHVLFERLTLQPSSELRIEPASGRDWVGVVSGQLGLTLVGDDLPPNWQSGREREMGHGEPLPILPVNTKVSLHNIGKEPLVLLRLRVTPLAEGGS